ncbi:MAG: histidine kinase [Bryobacteraceae bacterium]|nr:histidine kinase [Bryobacteraceae bacterium]
MMPGVLPVHEPLLVNTLGHSAGTLIFGIFLSMLLRDRAGARLRGSRLTLAAAALALLWNLASLLVIAWNHASGPMPHILVAVSSSALSLLPAVLLHLSLGGRFPWVRMAGYGLALVTIGIHTGELFVDAHSLHRLALRITTIGFGTLTLIAMVGLLRIMPPDRRLAPRLVATMSLFLFSLSQVHLGESHSDSWPVEFVAHHAGIVLALFVLLQDYRFLLLDAFLRFLANILLAAVFVFAAVRTRVWLEGAAGPFWEGMVLVGGCAALLLFAFLRSRLDNLFGRLLFSRQNVESLLHEIRTGAASASGEKNLVQGAALRVARFFDGDLIQTQPPAHGPALAAPAADLPPPDRERLETEGVEAVVPIRVSASETRWILLGRRAGGRRYLSRDFEALKRVQAELAEQVERIQETEFRRLMTQAELRALQSQIHPHFLFNALNTLYGVIPRQAEGARRTVLNLADIFRYFLNTDRQFIPLEEELSIVRAYLEIEALRLGPKLETEMDIAPEALGFSIPSLTVEPLVENAVKHGIAPNPKGGVVRIQARVRDGSLRITVSDTGAGFQQTGTAGAGVGLENVTRRLRLSYGSQADLKVDSGPGGTTVEFAVPAGTPELVSP